MKKFFSYAMMLVGASAAFVACDADKDSNPVLANLKPEFTLNTPEFTEVTVDLSKAEAYPLSWSQPQFLNPSAPTIVTYTVNLSKDGNFTKSYDEALIEAGDDMPTGHNYVVMRDDATNMCTLQLGAKAINLAVNQLYNNWTEDTPMNPVTVYARVTAAVVNAPLEDVAATYSNVVEIKVRPYWVNVNKRGVDCIYVPGNGQGWAPDSAPTLICDTEDGVYTGYAYLEGGFKFTIKRNWNDGQYNAGDFTKVSDNITPEEAGDLNFIYNGADLCYIVADIPNKTLEVTPVKWSLIGDFNGWGDDVFMEYDKSAKALVAKGVDITGGWKFRRDSAWDFNLGGSLTNLVQDGDNIAGDGEHDVYLYVECNGMGPGTATEEPVRYAVVK